MVNARLCLALNDYPTEVIGRSLASEGTRGSLDPWANDTPVPEAKPLVDSVLEEGTTNPGNPTMDPIEYSHHRFVLVKSTFNTVHWIDGGVFSTRGIRC